MISEVEFNNTDYEYFKTFKQKTFAAHKKSISVIDWNVLGTKLVSTDALIKVWNFDDATGLVKSAQFKGHENTIESVKWADSNVFLSVSKQALKIWDIRENKNVRNEKNEKKGKPDFTKASWSPDGLLFAVGNKQNIIHVFDKRITIPIDTIKFEYEIDDFEWDMSQSILIVAGWESTGNLAILQSKPRYPLIESISCHPAKITSIAIDPQNNYVATGGQDAVIDLIELDELICTRVYHKTDGVIHKLSFSYNSKYLAASCEENYVDIYNVENGTHAFRMESSNPQSFVRWHPKKMVLAYIDEDDKKKTEEGNIKLFSA